MSRGYEQIGVAMTCRSFAEYERMFRLKPELMEAGPILDVAAGASSFVAEAAARGLAAKAADPMYELSAEGIYRHGMTEIEVSTGKLTKLPHLPYEDESFGLVLCSHFLFLYHEQFDYDFHTRALRELLRVCRAGGEVRVYPVITLQWDRYPMLDLLLEELRTAGFEASLELSELPFIPGSKELLRVQK
ncbi:Methyltransferase domain-containing protein [Paenibacillus tianmuensis]|uniref:Methyltransferase domain-containing protein n=1 Tax=Paenibacillus tianmuensis TaxID=624147 RepID=A0A1G4RRK7_9BACL|nr:methyltransferase domain-containing protein [Paenibacillus tianmuensis]SCW59357.1 Methyltransferase domain-containing protein [Paenibacillus tianmuensis]